MQCAWIGKCDVCCADSRLSLKISKQRRSLPTIETELHGLKAVFLSQRRNMGWHERKGINDQFTYFYFRSIRMYAVTPPLLVAAF